MSEPTPPDDEPHEPRPARRLWTPEERARFWTTGERPREASHALRLVASILSVVVTLVGAGYKSFQWLEGHYATQREVGLLRLQIQALRELQLTDRASWRLSLVQAQLVSRRQQIVQAQAARNPAWVDALTEQIRDLEEQQMALHVELSAGSRAVRDRDLNGEATGGR